MSEIEQNTEQNISDNKVCTAFCPECKSDLYFKNSECICKNKECSWSCDGCKPDE